MGARVEGDEVGCTARGSVGWRLEARAGSAGPRPQVPPGAWLGCSPWAGVRRRRGGGEEGGEESGEGETLTYLCLLPGAWLKPRPA